jgi:hypothetical protein
LRMSFRWGWSFADVSSAQPGSRRRQATVAILDQALDRRVVFDAPGFDEV